MKNWEISETTHYLRNNNIFVEASVDGTTLPKFAVKVIKYTGDREDGGFGEFEIYEPEPWYLYRTWEEAMEVGIEIALKKI